MAGDAGVSNKLRRPNVRLKGQLSPAEMRRHFQEAAVYVHPARYEPFGLAVLEAAQCGCALVLGDIDSLREIWRDAAVYVDPDDHESLRHALLEVAADSGKRSRLASLAMRRARDFSADRMARAYLRIYQEMLSLPQPLLPAL
jgi:glycosyltransferase involved in cell wall biosynthesis